MSLGIPSWIRASAVTSARIGNIFIDLENLPEYLFKSCTHLLCRTGYDGFEVMLRGSMSLLKIGDAYMAFSTSHQSDDLDFKEVAIVLPEKGVYVTSNAFHAYRYRQQAESDADQVRAFNFSGSVSEHSEMKADFFDGSRYALNEELKDADFFLAFGCAGQDQEIEHSLEPPFGYQSMKLRVTVFYCEFESPTSDHSVFRLNVIGEPQGMDGISGGPVFCVLDRGGIPEVLFAGLIVRAGGNKLHFISAETVLEFVRFFKIGQGDATTNSTPR